MVNLLGPSVAQAAITSLSIDLPCAGIIALARLDFKYLCQKSGW